MRAIETFERVLGSRPIGWNSRGWPSENTRGILHELGGFLYHSEGCADDLPYYETGDGTPPILVIPYSKTYNDSRFLMNPGFASPRDFLETLVLGPRRAGARGRRAADDDDRRRARALERPGRARLRRCGSSSSTRSRIEGVSFMRRCDIASWWLEQYPHR